MNRVFFLGIVVMAAGVAAGLCPAVQAEDPLAGTTQRPAVSDRPKPDWVRTGESRYGWHWLVDHYDKDGNGTVIQKELPL